MDLYLIILPLYVVLLISTLVYLKLSVRELSKNQRDQTNTKTQGLLWKGNKNGQQKRERSHFCRIFLYLIKQFTIFVLFRGRRALLGLFTYSIISIFLYFGRQFWYIAPSFGIFITLVVFIVQAIEQRKIRQKKQTETTFCQNKWTVSKVFYSSCGVVTLSLYLAMCALIYRNYINSRILHFIGQLGIVFTIDYFGVRPVIFLLVSMVTKGSVTVLAMVEKVESEQMVGNYRVANNFEKQAETKNKLVFNLQIEPEPIDVTQQNAVIKNARILQKIPSSSIIEGLQFYQGSCQNILSHNESNKSHMSHYKKRVELSELQLQKIEECQNDELKQYFCLNVRRQKRQQQSKEMQAKLQVMKRNKQKMEVQDINNQFILENFAGRSPSKRDEFIIGEEKQQSVSVRSNSFCKSKGSIRGIKVAKQVGRQPPGLSNQDYDQRQETMIESTKNDARSELETTDIHKDGHMSRGRHNKINILKVHEQLREAGQLQQIDINSPIKRRNFNQTYCNQTTTIDDMKRKRHRRRASKIDGSQPYINTNRLLQIYCPSQNKSELDTYMKKQSIDRTFFNRTHKKSYSKGRDRPIVHEHDENQPEFYIPNF